ncbi:WD40 repeat domain-containing protein [bacterium]|nr:WD40 repeat domain-containing protein [bacterium]
MKKRKTFLIACVAAFLAFASTLLMSGVPVFSADALTLQIRDAHDGTVHSVAFSTDGKYLASSGSDAKIKVWDVNALFSDRRVETSQDSDSRTQAFSVAFSPDGKYLVSGSFDGTITIWSVQGRPNNLREKGTLSVDTNRLRQLAFSPDGKVLAVCAKDKIQFWDVEKASLLRELPEDAYAIAFSSDGKTLFSGDLGNVKLWNWETQEIVDTVDGYPRRIVSTIALSPDGKYLALSTDDNTIRLRNLQEDESEELINGHEDEITSLAFSPDSNFLISGSQDNRVRLWKLNSDPIEEATEVSESRWQHTRTVRSVAFSPAGSVPVTIASSGEDRKIIFWRPFPL